MLSVYFNMRQSCVFVVVYFNMRQTCVFSVFFNMRQSCVYSVTRQKDFFSQVKCGRFFEEIQRRCSDK